MTEQIVHAPTAHPPGWDGSDRRGGERRGASPDCQPDCKHLEHKIAQNSIAQREYFDRKLSEIVSELKEAINKGFPHGDPDAHRRVHEGYIKTAEERSKLWAGVKEKSVSGIVWFALIALGTAVWEWFRREVHK